MADKTNYRAESKKAIHTIAMESCDYNPSLNGCDCPKCGGRDTYDVKYDNYYLGCLDCETVVAIWIESDVANDVGLPWFIL